MSWRTKAASMSATPTHINAYYVSICTLRKKQKNKKNKNAKVFECVRACHATPCHAMCAMCAYKGVAEVLPVAVCINSSRYWQKCAAWKKWQQKGGGVGGGGAVVDGGVLSSVYDRISTRPLCATRWLQLWLWQLFALAWVHAHTHKHIYIFIHMYACVILVAALLYTRNVFACMFVAARLMLAITICAAGRALQG